MKAGEIQAPETLLGLVKHYSPSGNESEAVNWLVGHMDQSGYSQALIDEAGNAIGIMGSGPRQIVLLGHIDTVSGFIPVKQVGERLYGRGTVDAKGPLAAFVDATVRLGPIEGWQIVVIGAVDEERDSTGARYVVDRYHPEYAIIGEPSSWERITLGYKGSAWAEIETCQPRAHTAAEESSACEIAIEGWQEIQKYVNSYNQGKQKAFERLQVTLRNFSSRDDGFDEYARLAVGVRLPLGYLPQAWFAKVSSLLPAASVRSTSYAIPAFLTDKNTPLARAFLAGIRSTGGSPGYLRKTGTADLNIVGPAWNCPALAYGPGDSNLDHTRQEHILLPEYYKSVEVLVDVLRRLVGKEIR